MTAETCLNISDSTKDIMEDSVAEIRWYQHTFTNTFYMVSKLAIFLIYREVVGVEGEFTPSNWSKFVNSKELHDLIYRFVGTITEFALEAIAHAEMANNLGMEMHTKDCTIFIAAPTVNHDHLTNSDKSRAAMMEVATKVFTTKICHMFFKDICPKQFVILKNEGWFQINDEYECVPVK